MSWDPQQSYQRPRMPGFSFLPPGIRYLIGINVAIFFAEIIFGAFHFAGGVPFKYQIEGYFALWPIDSGRFYPWQFFTYMFLHDGIWHVGFNMLMLWWTGVGVEQAWGTKKFLIYYFLCGLGGSVAHLLLSGPLGIAGGPMIGASGAIFGVMVAFGVLFPDVRIMMFPIFIPIAAKYIVPILIAIEVYAASNGGDNVAHLAHLGGAVTGILYLLITSGGKLFALRRGGGAGRSQWAGSGTQSKGSGFFRRPQQPQRGGPVDAEYRDLDNERSQANSGNASNVGQSRVITQEEIDRILDKIAATGYQNLTNEERDILFEASKRMEERR